MLSLDVLAESQKCLLQNPRIQLVTSALYNHSIKDIARNPNVRIDDSFSTVVKHHAEPFDQENTGTCWLYAGLTKVCTEARIRQGCNIVPSTTYLMFYDKLEKAAVFLERFRRGVDERTRCHLLDNPITDGGSWSMFVHLIEKYGIVPREAYPQTFQSKDTAYLNAVLNDFLRRSVLTSVSERHMKQCLQKVHEILLCCLAAPPTVVQLKKKKDGVDFDGTPQELYRTLNMNSSAYVCVMHAPHRALHSYCAAFASNNYDNLEQHVFKVVSMADVKRCCMRFLKENIPLWFTANIAGGGDFERNILECDSIDYDLLFDMQRTSTKAELIQSHAVGPKHAMLLIGVHEDVTQGTEPKASSLTSKRWKVQNSWGKDKAFLTMSDAWFDANVFEVALPSFPEFVPHDVIKLRAWDRLSTVAA